MIGLKRGFGCVVAQAQNAQAAGAKALLVYDDQISDYFVPASDGTITGISIPSGSIPRRTGQLLVSSLLVSPSPCLDSIYLRSCQSACLHADLSAQLCCPALSTG